MKIFFTTTVQRSSGSLVCRDKLDQVQLQYLLIIYRYVIHLWSRQTYLLSTTSEGNKKTLRWVEGFSVFNGDVGNVDYKTPTLYITE
jgi:hypothetical protein